MNFRLRPRKTKASPGKDEGVVEKVKRKNSKVEESKLDKKGTTPNKKTQKASGQSSQVRILFIGLKYQQLIFLFLRQNFHRDGKHNCTPLKNHSKYQHD